MLDRTAIGRGTRVLDCGCGAGRFARLAAERGARIAGIDAAEQLIQLAAERTPEGDFRVGDLETLPWSEDTFDVVTGFSAFQFADDNEIACPIVFGDADAAVRAFVGAGPTALAIRHSSEPVVARAVRDALVAYTDTDGRITLPGWYRVVVANGETSRR